MKVLGLIPVRGGSKGVKGKNIRPLNGKPLVLYSIECALMSKSLSSLYVSTESYEIKEVLLQNGFDNIIDRPMEFALDTSPTIDAVIHAIETLEEKGCFFDAVCLLQATSPFRKPVDIDNAISILESTGSDSVISFVHVGEKHPARMKFIDTDGKVIDPPFSEGTEGQRRQDLPDVYIRDGSIYLTRTSILKGMRSFKGNDCRALIMPSERAINIDTEMDFFIADQMLKADYVL